MTTPRTMHGWLDTVASQSGFMFDWLKTDQGPQIIFKRTPDADWELLGDRTIQLVAANKWDAR